MCGRFEIDLELDLEELRKIDQQIRSKYNTPYKSGEIFPTDTVPILLNANGKPELQLMKWGIPKWDGKGHVINAKSETAAEKRLFSQAFFQRRCVVPSTGFYEWNKYNNEKKKEKFLFTTGIDQMVYMAGIFNSIKVGDALQNYFVILTQAANSSISDIHDRMPVLLFKNELKDWLRNDPFVETMINRSDVILERKIV
ncbi:MAG: yedK [Bacillales bacterium]|jgi:putative SOS response-associated peptidase YedK|nr:yedK [Bacillales bacterium]